MTDVIVSLFLLAIASLFSGLTLGYFSLSLSELRRKMELGDERAAIVYPLRTKGNQLLTTLIITNTLANAVLSVYLGNVLNGILAVTVSTILITIFAEILPQAIISRSALRFGATAAPFVGLLMTLFWPISYPLSRILNRALGDELPAVYSKDELVKIVEEHSHSDESDVEADELTIVENALSFGDRTIEEVMTPRSVVVAVEEGAVLSPELLNELHDSGHSRFPVYSVDFDHVVGILFWRDMHNVRDKIRAGEAAEGDVYFVNELEKLDHVLNAFMKTKNHMYIVVNEFKEMVGVITMEDVVEEILGREIVDEFDRYNDMREVALKRAKGITTPMNSSDRHSRNNK
jgi:metal transporter CNNM